ncbi:serine/threonine-protein kinase minibrain isoform X3 [Amborella trichopoda]|uniref:serine/threonine-protein kinase minibrain isoform X3 n=1 Tax=Amborella trichopoda TaxID=13333 RepID=UPI0009BE4AE7|nr:serine/threonine-protein kinase minibrain isoform X3 [Amborella trichopoda]|eukprot:XP_020524161.1 serine/threonine-protein kinase minibrain isoform X3 [Amborella trichopoda]
MEEASVCREDESGGREGARKSSWNPKQAIFRPYVAQSSSKNLQKPGNLRVVVNRPLVVRLTKDLVETYQLCNPTFKYCVSFNLKRYLTNPSTGVLNDGFDNANSDLILFVNLVLINSESRSRYIVKEILGQGTFGQVAKCWASETNSYVAVKIIKNQPAYYHQALVEVAILKSLNDRYDPDDKHHIVRMLDCFVYQSHLCISFEMLGVNLFELIKMNQYRGLPLTIVREFSKQILEALVVMKDASIIHCDLKPENILVSTSLQAAIKLIDFGSACYETQTVYSYIQSRYYRSPEVLLGYQYTTAIDMWSFGCIVAELFLGMPLFPGASEYDLIKRMIETLGGQPPDHMLGVSKNTNKLFKYVSCLPYPDDDEANHGSQSGYRLLTEEEYEARELKRPVLGKQYFSYVKLKDIVNRYPLRKNMPEEDISREKLARLSLIDFLRGLVEFDPVKRWTPLQAVLHPFLTEEPFTCPYKPPPESPRIPVCQALGMGHTQGTGHWFDSAFSPQVSTLSKGPLHNSPHRQPALFTHPSSYGSVGSYGSYNESGNLGSSYGSYGDNAIYIGYSSFRPSGLNNQAQGGQAILGASPDARWRMSQVPHGTGLGISPGNGNIRPMSLGVSPSQFTPPSSQMQAMQISACSPGRYGPTSPARGGVHGSPLGKAAAVAQYNRRRSLGYQGNMGMSPQEHRTMSLGDGSNCHLEGNSSRAYIGSSRGMQAASSLRLQKGANGFSQGHTSFGHQNPPLSCGFVSHGPLSPTSEASCDKPESSSPPPDPGDWDPNYSDDLLLQEEGSDSSSLSSAPVLGGRPSHPPSSTFLTGAIRPHRSGNHPPTSTSSSFPDQRANGPFQAYGYAEGFPPLPYNMQAGYGHLNSKPLHHMPLLAPHNSPSRLGQQTSHHYQPILNPPFAIDERIQLRGPPSWASVGPQSPGRSPFANDTSWGRRAGHPITTIPPTAHGRNEYGRIS